MKSYKPLETFFSGLLLIASGLAAVILLSNNLHFNVRRILIHNLPTFDRVETFAIWTMFRLRDVGKGVNTVGIDTQGLPVRRG